MAASWVHSDLMIIVSNACAGVGFIAFADGSSHRRRRANVCVDRTMRTLQSFVNDQKRPLRRVAGKNRHSLQAVVLTTAPDPALLVISLYRALAVSSNAALVWAICP